MRIPLYVRGTGVMNINQLIPTEAQEAAVLVAYLRRMDLRFHHSPNETGSSPEARRRAVRVKREGTSAGFPDYVILVPPERTMDGVGRTLYVELKRKRGGTVSPQQREWLSALNSLRSDGIDAVVAHGADEAIEYVGGYLKSSDTSPF